VKFSSPEFILSFLINGALIGYAIYGLIKRKVPAYAILFYFITFSIVSNLFFTVGVLMNERFVFFSSVGFCILLAYAIFRLLHILKLDVIKFTPIFVGVIVLLYSIKTITRNTAWENNYKLFLTDVAYSPNSAKLQTSVGGDMTKEADALTDTIQKKLLLQEAITHLNKAIAIYPNHSNALLLLGNALYKLNKNPNEVIPIYNKAEQTRQGGYYDANYNVGCVEIENGMPQLAKENFLKAYSMSPTMHECVFNLGEAYAQTGNIDSALYFYKHSIELKPTTPNGYYKVGTIYGKQLNQLDSAIVYLNKAVEYGPNVELYYEDLAVAYGLKNNIAKAIEVSLNCLKFNPNYLPSIRILAISYKRMGDQANAQRYAKMANMTL
jgi:tetratricopeptide (TPR) repeat protein